MGLPFELIGHFTQINFIPEMHRIVESVLHDPHSDLIQTCNTLGSYTQKSFTDRSGLSFLICEDNFVYVQMLQQSGSIQTCLRHFSHCFGSCSPHIHTLVIFVVSSSSEVLCFYSNSHMTTLFLFTHPTFNPLGMVIGSIH